MIQRTAWMVLQGERAGHKNLTGLSPSQRARFSELTIDAVKNDPFCRVEETFGEYLQGQNCPPDLYGVIVWLSAFSVPGQDPERVSALMDVVLSRLGFTEDTERQRPIPSQNLYWLETLVEAFLVIAPQLPRSFTTRLRRIQVSCEKLIQGV